MRVKYIRETFKDKLKSGNFCIDKTGVKTIEIIGASFIADEPSIFGVPSEEYINLELEWYRSGSTNINDIYGPEREPPAAWQYAANTHGEINSNYGHIIYSDKYFNQYNNVINELKNNPDSRRAQLVYNRPSVWKEYNENGKSDFICTNAQTFYIRDGKLDMVSQMRSNDAVFGYKNDYAWAKYLMDDVAKDLDLEVGELTWQVMNLHVYERHFKFLI